MKRLLLLVLIVTMLTVGSIRVLFMGDWEKPQEKDILDHGYNLKADVLKVAHPSARTVNRRQRTHGVTAFQTVLDGAIENENRWRDGSVLRRKTVAWEPETGEKHESMLYLQ